MAKSINSNNKNEDEEEKSAELTAATTEEAGVEYDDLVAVSRAEESQKVKASKRGNVRGKSMPLLKRLRDTDKDKQPLAPEQMGLSEEDTFLTTREVSPIDLRRHQDVHQKDLLGTNFRKPRDFMRMFDKGQSSKQQPKLDLTYNVEANPDLKRELIAEQILRNLHSRETIERWQALANNGEWPVLVNELLAQHYDALYKRSQSLHFTGLDTPQTFVTDDLTPAGVDALAQQICSS